MLLSPQYWERSLDASSKRVRLIPGFFNETLTAKLAKEIAPASYVDINCDLYVSTSQALDFLFRFHIARPGTLISYDDWHETPLHNGESLAHEEAARMWNVEFEYLPHAACEAAAFPTLTFFRVRSIGVRAEPGLTANLTALRPHYKRFDRAGG